jgi:ADP-ribose pyrophosphatase
VQKLPFAKVYEMVLNGEITDSMTIIAIHKAKYLIEKGEI